MASQATWVVLLVVISVISLDMSMNFKGASKTRAVAYAAVQEEKESNFFLLLPLLMLHKHATMVVLTVVAILAPAIGTMIGFLSKETDYFESVGIFGGTVPATISSIASVWYTYFHFSNMLTRPYKKFALYGKESVFLQLAMMLAVFTYPIIILLFIRKQPRMFLGFAFLLWMLTIFNFAWLAYVDYYLVLHFNLIFTFAIQFIWLGSLCLLGGYAAAFISSV